ncbi:hypothetical protein SUGI_0427650 [Cryptomeria japonica]|uniref:GDSL esterase/lipase At5g03820-like n=1 Tax=Cryptomeria japonica TaxID=3369 RepID=UPI002408D1A1|nr:GDSL esterase/lipase At5g03820-like [Cryptomeria japonica]GLJ22705.1 hypothetical protein SUGI_0427650 [Cryptomeria japonica]
MAGSVKLSILYYFLLSILILYALKVESDRPPLFQALYVFGDSMVDPGNNNDLLTLAKANFHPYGKDFLNATPTGRFTNGKLATDILSQLMGLPDLVPAYNDPEFKGQKLLRGVSFASAAAGLEDSTSNLYNVITLGKQVENFRNYKEQLANIIGQADARKIVSEALYVISMGTNDFILNYYLNPLRRKQYNITQWQDLLINSLERFIQNISKEGATRLAIVGVPPFGCLPSQIALYNPFGNTCYKKLNKVATSFNSKMMNLIQKMNSSLEDLRIDYFHLYGKLYDIVKNPRKYGFEESRRGCCGKGGILTPTLCYKGSPSCSDVSKYVFWDGNHPTSRTYVIIANDFLQLLAWNAQDGDAAVLLIANDHKLNDTLGKDEKIIIKLDWSKSMPRPDKRLEYEFWTKRNYESNLVDYTAKQ